MKGIAAILATVTLGACASIMHGTSQDVGISSSPTAASVTVDNKGGAQTPYIAHLRRKDNHIVKLTVPGYMPAEMTLTRKTSGWVWGNVVFGGIIGLAVDAMTGGLYNLSPEQLSSTLASEKASIAPTRDGIYVILARVADPAWIKVGQLTPTSAAFVGE